MQLWRTVWRLLVVGWQKKLVLIKPCIIRLVWGHDLQTQIRCIFLVAFTGRVVAFKNSRMLGFHKTPVLKCTWFWCYYWCRVLLHIHVGVHPQKTQNKIFLNVILWHFVTVLITEHSLWSWTIFNLTCNANSSTTPYVDGPPPKNNTIFFVDVIKYCNTQNLLAALIVSWKFDFVTILVHYLVELFIILKMKSWWHRMQPVWRMRS